MDPLCEKYYSVSPYVYCMNNPVRLIDPDGKDVAILIAKDGAMGYGHMAAIIQDENGSYYYTTVGATNTSLSKVIFSDVDGGMLLHEIKFKNSTPNMANAIKFAKQDTNNSIYTDAIVFSTTPEMDKNIKEEAQKMKDKIDTKEIKYNAFENNCADAIQQILEKALGI